jgi:hypothetical protein
LAALEQAPVFFFRSPYVTGENHERAVLKTLLGELDPF